MSYSAAGSSMCTACPEGSYSSYGAGSCSACGAGHYSSLGGACELCPSGTFAEEGSSNCTVCASGYFSNPGSELCSTCDTWHPLRYSSCDGYECSKDTASSTKICCCRVISDARPLRMARVTRIVWASLRVFQPPCRPTQLRFRRRNRPCLLDSPLRNLLVCRVRSLVVSRAVSQQHPRACRQRCRVVSPVHSRLVNLLYLPACQQ